jgi:hypothetical protein
LLANLVEFNDEEELLEFCVLSSPIFKIVEHILTEPVFNEDQLGEILDELDILLEYGGKLSFNKI